MKVLSARSNSYHLSKSKEIIRLGHRRAESFTKGNDFKQILNQSASIQKLEKVRKLLVPKPIKQVKKQNLKIMNEENKKQAKQQWKRLNIADLDVDDEEPASPIHSITKIIRADSINQKKETSLENMDFKGSHVHKLRLYAPSRSPFKISLQ